MLLHLVVYELQKVHAMKELNLQAIAKMNLLLNPSSLDLPAIFVRQLEADRYRRKRVQVIAK